MASMTYANKYLEADILGRSRPWLVPLLYEHAVAALRRLALCAGAGEHAAVMREQDRATRIVGELLSSLDLDQGGRIASDLVAIYGFIMAEVPLAVRRRDRVAIDRLASMLGGLHAAWLQAAEHVAPRRVLSA